LESIELEQVSWDSSGAVRDTLDFYADNGDVQTALMMALVLGDSLSIPKPKLRAWTMSYVEQLHRLQLWIPATEIMQRSKEDDIRNFNKMATTIYTSCPNCQSLLNKNGWSCEKCKKTVSHCSIW
jgi:hypothetical protein